jgi:DNA-binding NarL/FixJ family response regulator
MTARQERYDLGPLADFMAEDILSTPGRQLVDEVAEDCGDPEALASAFDKIVHAERPSRGDSPTGLSIALGQHNVEILVVDDHVLIREALRGVLKEVKGNATVLEASSCSQAMQVIAAHPNLDLILLDLNLPDRDGFSVLTELGERYPAISVVVLSAQQDRGSVVRALDLGALGFIPKSGQREVMLSALQLVFAGGIYIPPEILVREEPSAQQRDEKPPVANRPTVSPADLGLTERQVDVLSLMMQGKSNKAICRVLNLAEPTVKNHVTAILKALEVSNRTEAVIAAGQLGWKLPPVSKS